MPKIAVGDITVEKVAGDVFKVRIDVSNDRVIPSITTRGANNNVVRPDLLTVEGAKAEVIAAGIVASKFRPDATNLIDQHDLSRIMLRNGQPGNSTRTIEYLIRGSGDVTFTYDSVKGGVDSETVSLR
jgi:hypothetical protein